MHQLLRRQLALTLITAMTLAALPAVVAPARAAAAPVVHRAAIGVSPRSGPSLARLGGFRTSSRYRSPYSYRRGYRSPYRSRGFGRGFFHGLFWGWMLSHFFGGGYGFPLFIPFLLILFVLVTMRRRRRPPAYRYRTW